MVLPAEEDGEEADDLPFFVQVEVEDGAVLGDAADLRAKVGAAGALVGRAGEGTGGGEDFFSRLSAMAMARLGVSPLASALCLMKREIATKSR